MNDDVDPGLYISDVTLDDSQTTSVYSIIVVVLEAEDLDWLLDEEDNWLDEEDMWLDEQDIDEVDEQN